MPEFVYDFEWDPAKAQTNAERHGLDFERAAEVFRDPLALTVSDEEHSITEARWITLGRDMRDQYVIVIHTFEELDATTARIRIISARRPTKSEIRQYEEQP
jgi:uncharacterized protein